MKIKRLSDNGSKTISKANKLQIYNGKKKEKHIGYGLKRLGIKFTDKKVRFIPSDIPGMVIGMNVDYHLSDLDIHIEGTSSTADTKECKTVVQAKSTKEKCPNSKFVVFVVSQPRGKASHINNLNSCPYIDKVITIWQDEWKYVKELRRLIDDKLKSLIEEYNQLALQF